MSDKDVAGRDTAATRMRMRAPADHDDDMQQVTGPEARDVARQVSSDAARILVVDNYDSFVYTIVGYLRTLGAQTEVVRNDAIDPVCDPEVLDAYDGVLISPGPGTPADAGVSENVIRLCAQRRKPMLGVCLGLQALAEVYGAKVDHAPNIMHGKTSLIDHDDDALFAGTPNPVTETRYHSLAVEPDTLPAELKATAIARNDGTVQAIRHTSLPLYAVQFHPESVMSESGYRIFANWLAMCGQGSALDRAAKLGRRISVGQ